MWRAPETFPKLGRNQAHCWRADLSALASLRDWSTLLSEDEQTRAARFHFEKDRAQFACARGVLRTLLGRYLGRAPHDLEFVYNAHGKPKLSNQGNARVLRFNVSHSREQALFAFAPNHDIGVDIEFMREDWSDEYLLKLTTRFFHPREIEVLGTLENPALRENFFQFWTRKEALIKARGDGIWRGLDFDATRVLAGWTQLDLSMENNFAGALAIEAREIETKFWEFQTSVFIQK